MHSERHVTVCSSVTTYWSSSQVRFRREIKRGWLYIELKISDLTDLLSTLTARSIRNPPIVLLDKQLDHDLFNFPILPSYLHPLLGILRHRTTGFMRFLIATKYFLIWPSSRPLNAFDEDDLVFSGVKFVANDYLVAVTFQRRLGFWDEECEIGLELHRSARQYQ